MKNILLLPVVLAFFSFGALAQPFETFHDFTQLTITHDTLPLSTFAGKKVLVVNTASYCGFTYELGDLQKLDSMYSGPGFAIVGFPCNDFGGQEPYDDSTIQLFYRQGYGVGFQLMSKIAITSVDTAEVYKWLQLQNRNGVANANVTWNFNKFCIDEAGHWIRHFSQTVNPLDTAIVNWILSPNTTGVLPIDHSAEVVLRGNPSHGNINFEIRTPVRGNFSAGLFDLQGKQLEKIFSGDVENTQNISYAPENLSPGIYFLKVQSGTTNKVLKVCYIN